MAAIELDGVTKRFGDVTAVRDLDLTVPEGEVFGFLGPNGAGKSTTINMLLDFVRPTEGAVRALGMDAQEESVAVRSRTGVLPEGFSTYSRLTGRQHIEFAIESKGVGAVGDGSGGDGGDSEEGVDPEAVLKRVGIADAADRKAGGYSTGMAQRLALGMALVGEPELLILDEPSTGLDPAGAKEMREIVREEADRGATVFFSSHILGQVEAVCDTVGILRDGELVARDSVEGLRDAVGEGATLEITVDAASDAQLEPVRAVEGVTSAAVEGNEVTVQCDPAAKTDVIAILEEQGVVVSDFQTREASLEDLFLAYTEGSGSEAGVEADAEASSPGAAQPSSGDRGGSP